MKKYLLLASVILLTGCAAWRDELYGVPFNPKTYTGYVEKRPNAQFQADALRGIRGITFDPKAVQFENLLVITKFKRKFLCGELNAKNRFDAYVGFQSFIYYVDVNGIIQFENDEDSDYRYSLTGICFSILKSNLVNLSGQIIVDGSHRNW
ncbi:MAG: hypothetical protein QM529_01525 [Hydrotalea sp.]|nr:hypothetical protein [Hydrotalea sp.]